MERTEAQSMASHMRLSVEARTSSHSLDSNGMSRLRLKFVGSSRPAAKRDLTKYTTTSIRSASHEVLNNVAG